METVSRSTKVQIVTPRSVRRLRGIESGMRMMDLISPSPPAKRMPTALLDPPQDEA